MSEKFEMWAVVELFGHARIAGKASEQVIAGGAFLRVDVPEVGDQAGFTRFYGANAIYSITPTTEEIARNAVEVLSVRPITVYGVVLPERQLMETVEMDDEPDGDPDLEDGFYPDREIDF